jgi:hypothetical protein
MRATDAARLAPGPGAVEPSDAVDGGAAARVRRGFTTGNGAGVRTLSDEPVLFVRAGSAVGRSFTSFTCRPTIEGSSADEKKSARIEVTQR